MKRLVFIILILALIVSFFVSQRKNKVVEPEIEPEYIEIGIGYSCDDYEYLAVEINGQEEILCDFPSPSPTPINNVAVASWYDKSTCGERIYGENCKTASGEVFDENKLGVAHKSMKFGTVIGFSYNGKYVECVVNDRGPFVDGRDFDLSKGCAEALGFTGVKSVNYQVIPRKEANE